MSIAFVSLWGNGVVITDPAEADSSVLVERPWGWELRVDLRDTETGKVYNETFEYRSVPTKVEVRSNILARMAEIEARLYAEAHPPTKTVTCQDGFALAVPESICPVDIDMTINPTSQQLAAWNLIRPLLKTYLSHVLRVWEAAPEQYRGLLRQHNTLLDQALTMMDK